LLAYCYCGLYAISFTHLAEKMPLGIGALFGMFSGAVLGLFGGGIFVACYNRNQNTD
jgi:hypothetical protein